MMRPLPLRQRLPFIGLAILSLLLNGMAFMIAPEHSLARVYLSCGSAAVMLVAVFVLLRTRRSW